MMSIPITCIFGLSALSLVFGFIALLAQKTYIDTNSQQQTEIEVPILGKMKTNFPALVFVFLGIGLPLVALHYLKPVTWTISGKFTYNGGEDIAWQDGTLAVSPASFKAKVEPDGRFTIEADIEEGKTFEEAVKIIDYSHPRGSIQIIPKKELRNYETKQNTSLDYADGTTRIYKPIPLENY